MIIEDGITYLACVLHCLITAAVNECYPNELTADDIAWLKAMKIAA